MIFPIVLGIIVATSHPPLPTALALIAGFIVARGVTDILFAKRFITGTPSPYVLYVQNLSHSGDLPSRPWLGYLLQVCVFYIPLALITFFLTRLFVH